MGYDDFIDGQLCSKTQGAFGIATWYIRLSREFSECILSEEWMEGGIKLDVMGIKGGSPDYFPREFMEMAKIRRIVF